MKKILLLFVLLAASFCTSDEKKDNIDKTEEQMLEDERERTQNEIDSLKKEIEDLRNKRDSIKSISPDSAEVN